MIVCFVPHIHSVVFASPASLRRRGIPGTTAGHLQSRLAVRIRLTFCMTLSTIPGIQAYVENKQSTRCTNFKRSDLKTDKNKSTLTNLSILILTFYFKNSIRVYVNTLLFYLKAILKHTRL